jgi:hypothetical protein
MNNTREMKSTHLLASLAIALFCASCEDDKQVFNPPPAAYGSGTIVINEGPFTAGSGSLTYISADGARVEQEVFLAENGYPAGAVLNSASMVDDRLVIISNVSGRIESVDRASMQSRAVNTELGSPRYAIKAGPGTIAATDWSDNSVNFFDRNLQKIKSVECGVGPEQMVSSIDRLFVLNSGGFGRDSSMTVIGLDNLEVQSTLYIGDIPNSALIANSSLWVLCSGYADWTDPANDTEGQLVQIDLNTLATLAVYPIPLSIGHPGDLIFDQVNNRLCFLSNAYSGSIIGTDLGNPGSFTSLKGGSYYSLDYDPIRGQIVAGNALSFAEAGWMIRFNSSMAIDDSVKVGLIPTDFVFN